MDVVKCTGMYSSLPQSIDGVDPRGHVDKRMMNKQHELR